MELAAVVCIATISASILIAIFNKWWDPIAVYVGYPFGVHRRVEDLGVKVKTLSAMQIDLRYEDPFPSSEERIRWLKSVDDLQRKEKKIKDGLDECGLTYFKRCYIGKEADTELNRANDLVSQGGRLLSEVQARPHPVRDVQPQHLQDPLPGMVGSYEKVLRFINDKSAQSVLLGVWGMGGVGKTTLLNLVRDSRSKYDDDSFEVLLVEAGRNCTVAGLQKTIAISMALAQIDNEISQANIIYNHLKDKSFLLLLDDLWRYLDLKTVGIPSLQPQGDVVQPHRRKVVLTTRSMDVCGTMGCRRGNTIRMECLSDEDAWNLFAHKVGDKICDAEGIHELAKQIVKECSGLPMALCTIGQFMSSKKDLREWRTTRDLLKMSKLDELTASHEDLFKRLQVNCDNMKGDMKERFLLCSLWPENENISMEKLIRWWTGLGLLNMGNASDMGYTIINGLVRESMLEKGDTGLDSTENSHVKMHNMIRKMAIWIVNEHGYKKWLPHSSYRLDLPVQKWEIVEKAWVSLENTLALPSIRPLNMLVARHEISLELIRYFQNITFLDLEGTRIGTFPVEICSLIQLEHLNLSATTIDALHPELRRLSNLKYLYIRNNMGLRTIPEGLILKLKKLRRLDLFRTGVPSSLLAELASPTTTRDGLHMLGFTVQTIADITRLRQLKNMCTQALCMHHFEDESHQDNINLHLLSFLGNLRELAIIESSDSQKVLVAEGGPKYRQGLLPYLEMFELNNLLKLEKVTWKNAGMEIRVVSIYKCDKLKDVTWVHSLKLLEQLTIAHCQEMERLIEIGELPPGMNQTAISFPRLKKLKLEELPKLSMISEQACQFEELSYICVARCNEMKDIRFLQYNQSMIKIDCSEDWWNRNSLGRFIPYLAPTFCS